MSVATWTTVVGVSPSAVQADEAVDVPLSANFTKSEIGVAAACYCHSDGHI